MEEKIINNSKDNNYKNNQKEISKIKYFKVFLKVYDDLKKILKNEDKLLQLKNFSKQYIIDEEEKIDIITNKIIETYQDIISNFHKLTESIYIKIEQYINDITQQQNKQNTFEEIKKILNLKIKKLLELKNNYHMNGEHLEKLVLQTFENNEDPSNELNSALIKTNESLDKYKAGIIEINEFKKEYNKFKILNNNYSKLQLENIFLFDSIKDEFNNNLEKSLKLISKTILDVNTRKKLNPKRDIDNNKINNKIIKEIESLKIETIIHYPTKIDFNECFDEKEFLTFDKTIKFIKSKINDKDLYQSYDEQKEKERQKKRQKLIFFFDNNIQDISIENKNEFINIIKDASFHKSFLLLMSKFRIKNEKCKAWIDLMGNCINIILDKYSVDNNYDIIKNCIILSQTYYYIEEDNNQKIYIFNSIKNRELFYNTDFWKNIIDFMILKQLNEYQKKNDIILLDYLNGNYFNNNINLNNKLSDLLFSQILPFVNNMVSFNISNENIINIVNYFKEKYKYLSEDNYNAILSLLLNNVK